MSEQHDKVGTSGTEPELNEALGDKNAAPKETTTETSGTEDTSNKSAEEVSADDEDEQVTSFVSAEDGDTTVLALKSSNARENDDPLTSSSDSNEDKNAVSDNFMNLINKRQGRMRMWRKMRMNSINLRLTYNRLPQFKGQELAAERLAETEEFQRCVHFKVYTDHVLTGVRAHVVQAGKMLSVPAKRWLNCVYMSVNVPKGETEVMGSVTSMFNSRYIKKVMLSDADKFVKFDMLVVGSVVVSRLGQRLGRGNHFSDVDFALMSQLGLITDDTIVATIVHDVQLVDALPDNIFTFHDFPVDLIVTPTQVVRISQRAQRPKQILWDQIDQRFMRGMPVLKLLKPKTPATAAVESDGSRSPPPKNRRRKIYKSKPKRHPRMRDRASQTDDVPEIKRLGLRNSSGRKRPYFRKRNELRDSANKGKILELSKMDAAKQQRQEKLKSTKQLNERSSSEFCIKLSNLHRGIRLKDLKNELRKRDCRPQFISWKVNFGKCFLHFSGKKAAEEELKKLVESLNGLTLTVPNLERKWEDDNVDADGNKRSLNVTVQVELIDNIAPMRIFRNRRNNKRKLSKTTIDKVVANEKNVEATESNLSANQKETAESNVDIISEKAEDDAETNETSKNEANEDLEAKVAANAVSSNCVTVDTAA